MAFVMNPDGTVSVNGDWFTRTFDPQLGADQQYAIEHNTALNQFNQQMDFSREQFEYNKDLSERQQALSEESYRFGALNQARQMAQLGINPASSVGSVSGMSMSGGHGASSAIPSGRGSSGSVSVSGLSSVLGILGTVGDLASTIAGIKQSKAETDNINADTSVKEGQAAYNDALARSAQYRAEIDRGNTEFLKVLGISDKEYTSLSNLRITTESAVAIGANLGVNLSLGMFGTGVSGSAGVNGSSSSSTSTLISGDVLAILLNSEDSSITGNKLYKAIASYSDVDSSGSRPLNVPADWEYVGDSRDSYIFKTSSGRKVYIGK